MIVEIDGIKMKYCPRCEQNLGLEMWDKGGAKDGLQSWCKKCRGKAQREKRDKQKSPEQKEWEERRRINGLNGMKYCPKCKQNLPRTMWGKNRSNPDGLQGWCKKCLSKKSQQWAKDNSEYVKIRSREAYRNHKESKGNNWVSDNPEYNKQKTRECRARNPQAPIEASRKWAAKHPDFQRQYAISHRAEATERTRLKRQNNLNIRLANKIRGMTRKAFLGELRDKSSVELLGLPIVEFQEYLNNLWLANGHSKGLTTKTKFEIHHVVPLSYGWGKSTQVKSALCHFTNLIPLTHKEHLAMGGDKLPEGFTKFWFE